MSVSDTLIVAMFSWSVAHDRPRCWAADRANYHGPFRPRRLASRSQFDRRLASPRCQALTEAVWRALAEGDDGPTWNFMDGRALPVGAYSQDTEAGRGVIAGHFAKGYKLHAITRIDGKIRAWRVAPLNVSEKTVADELIVETKATGWLLADGNYDAGRLYDLACRHGAVMFTPLPKNAGGGHRPPVSHAALGGSSLGNSGGCPHVWFAYHDRAAVQSVVVLRWRIGSVAAMGARAATGHPMGWNQTDVLPCSPNVQGGCRVSVHAHSSEKCGLVLRFGRFCGSQAGVAG